MRTVTVLGKTLSVMEANDLVSQIKTDIHALGKPAPPKYEGPVGEELTQLIKFTVEKGIASLKRDDYPRDGVASQFGVDLNVRGWNISFSKQLDSPNDFHIGVQLERKYLPNEDGYNQEINLDKEIIEAIKNGVKDYVTVWNGPHWVSFTLSEKAPKSIMCAYQNYRDEKYKAGLFFELFQNWFKEGAA